MLNRKKNQTNDYVFPGAGAAGHIIEPRKSMAHVTKASGIHFTVHDLRRTFITIAESMDIPAYALKRLMNHKMSNDVTSDISLLMLNVLENQCNKSQIIF